MDNYNRGTKYLERRNYTKAVQFLRRELSTHEFKECWLNLGNALNQLNQPTKACQAFQRAADDAVPFLSGQYGVYPDALNNLGLLAYAHNAPAAELYKLALEHNPLHYDAIFNLSLAELREQCTQPDESWSATWRLYEYRFRRQKPTHIAQHVPRWDGVSPGAVCVVLSEQGLGDHIQFARYLPQLQQYFARVVLQCPQQLHGLWPDVECVVDCDIPSAVGIPLMSLAGRFKAVAGDYLRGVHTPHEFAHTRLNIGCEWSGSQTHANARARNCAPGYFSGLAEFGNLYSIRPGAEPVAGVTALNSRSWAQSAEFVAGLDLVITVDTSLVHLAGSLGVPTWLLQPTHNTDFRWGLPNMGTANIWYDSVQVVRNPDSWSETFAQVRASLQQLCTTTC